MNNVPSLEATAYINPGHKTPLSPVASSMPDDSAFPDNVVADSTNPQTHSLGDVPKATSTPTPVNVESNNTTKSKGGRQKEGRTIWVEDRFREGLTPAEILKKWDKMSDKVRRSIDKKKWRPFVSPKITDESELRVARRKALRLIEKKRPK